MSKKSKAKLVQFALIGGVVVVVAAIALHEWSSARKAATATAAAWMIAGPPCPTLAPGVSLPPLPKPIEVDDVVIAREVGGAAACTTVKENGDGQTLKICQFFTPGTLKVTTKKGTAVFAPAHGVDASIVVRDDVASCVLHVNPALLT